MRAETTDAPASFFEVTPIEGGYLEDIAVGEAAECGRFVLSEAEIVDFARRFDPQPAHIDPGFAATTPAGVVTASAAHTFAVAVGIFARAASDCRTIAAVTIHPMELPAPAKAGVELRIMARWTEKRESRTKPDRGIASWQIEVIDPAGTVVFRTGATILVHRRPAA